MILRFSCVHSQSDIKGRFVFGYVGDVPVVIMQGRVHYYEGYSMEDVVLPTRLMKMMGGPGLVSDQCFRQCEL